MWWWESVAWGSRCHGVGNVRPCWWGPGLFPEARNGASLRGCSWGSQWRKRVATGLLPGARATTTWNAMLFLRLTTAGIGISFFAAVSRRMFVGTRLFRLTGSGANWWRRSQSQVVKWPCAWQPTQRRTPDSHRHPPPTSLCSSRMMCERVPSAPKCE